MDRIRQWNIPGSPPHSGSIVSVRPKFTELWVFSNLSGYFVTENVLDRLEGAGEDLQSEVFFVGDAVRSPLDDADLAVQSFDESE